ncbi:MAG: hypothetical protein HYS12_18290 [Planctomycetes bacterium]|nr:hypothetical protein [Planctomycetota bacterium]
MNEHGLSRLLLGLASEDTEPTTMPTPSCLPLPRFRTALLREDWTDAEQRHKAGCDVCRQTEAQARRQVWHPSLLRLFWHARGLVDDADAARHLQTDACRRCQRLSILLQADRLLARLATRVRQRAGDTATRLGRMLASGASALLAPASSGLRAEQPFAFEAAGHSAVLLRTAPPLLRLERPGNAQTPVLLRVLLGDRKDVREQFTVPRPGKEPGGLHADLPLERLPAEPLTLALYEVDAAVLGIEEVSQLCHAFAAARKLDPLAVPAWQTWASHALKLAGLDAAVRPALEALTRPAAGAVR